MTKKETTAPKKSESAKSKTKPIRAKKIKLPGKDLFDTLGITLKEIGDRVEDRVKDAWDNVQVNGFYVGKDEIPDCSNYDLAYEGVIDDEDRIQEMENGAPPSDEEKERFREKWLRDYFDSPISTIFGLVMVQGRIVLLEGDSFDTNRPWVCDEYATWEEALDSMDEKGVRDRTLILDSDLKKSLGKYESQCSLLR